MNGAFGPFLVIGLGLILGFLLRRSGHLPAGAPRGLNAYVIIIALPGVVLSQLPPFFRGLMAESGTRDLSFLFLPLLPWLIFGAAILFFGWIYRRGWIRRDQYGLLVLSGGLGNTSFVGLPLLEALLGRESLPLGILLDQLGTFLALSLGGTAWIAYFRSESTGFSGRRFLRELFRFPPFVAVIAAFVLSLFPPFPGFLQLALERIGSTLVPVAMVSVGATLNLDPSVFRTEAGGLAWGLGFKMLLTPIFFGLLSYFVFQLRGEVFAVALLESAMAPMITATVLGMEAGFAPGLGALMLGIGIPLSLLTVPLLYLLWS